MARNFRICVFLSLGCCLSCVVASAVAADLRSSIDERTIVRTVSVQQATEVEPQPEPELESIPGYTTEEMGYDAGYLPSCGCDDCGCADQTWAGVEYLLWWRNGRYFPALVTTQPSDGTLPGATVLFGGGEIQEVARPGGRLEVGHWFDNNHCLGIGGHLVAIANAPVNMALTSDQLSFIARPFWDADPAWNVPRMQPIADTSIKQPGRIDLSTGSEVLASDVFVRWLLYRERWARLDFLLGYQFARIDENLVVNTYTDGRAIDKIKAEIYVRDEFSTRNEYNAGHFGLQGEYVRGRWGLELLAKFGFGTMREQVSISGLTKTVTGPPPLGVAEKQMGLLALPTNINTYNQDSFCFMDDVGVKLAFCPVERLKLSVGYSLMYWSNVVRPGDQIDAFGNQPIIDTRQYQQPPPPGVTHPAFAFNTTSFMVHGLNLGLEVRF
ncbi:MAG: BBP7 family outer membrane beta-barrel protein [Planctomycetota bacterium]|nr:BBP7 family outer membrane beta-barrel protein [Planctomycetota bacterium]